METHPIPPSELPRPDHEELTRRLDAIRLALGAEAAVVARRMPHPAGPEPAFEILGHVARRGRVHPPETDVPIGFVAELLRDGRPQEWSRHAADPARRRRLVSARMSWLGGWPLPSDRWPCVAIVAWCRERRDPGAVRRSVAEAGMEALARALTPPTWMPFAPLRPVRAAPDRVPVEEPDDDSLAGALARVERELIVQALQAAEGNKTRAARALRLSRQGLYRKLRRHGLVATRREPRQSADD